MTALLFDMDGLLSDTEVLHCRAYQETLAEFGQEITAEEYAAHWIRQGKGITDWLEEKKLPFSADRVRGAKTKRYHHYVKTELQAMPFARETLSSLAGRVPMALVTASHAHESKAVLTGLGFATFFSTVVNGDDVARTKPFPDGFLLAAERLKVAPSDCIVLEDAEKGVRAAKAAGMRVIAVPNHYTAKDDFSMADWVVENLPAARQIIEGIL